MKRLAVILAITLLFVASYSPVPTAEAATDPTLFVGLLVDYGDCQTNAYRADWSWLSTDDDDGANFDYVGVITYDANGVRIAAEWQGWIVGQTYEWLSTFGTQGNGMNAFTARPLTLEMIDLRSQPPKGYNTDAIYSDIEAQRDSGAPVLLTVTYDPANDAPDCASLPFIAPPPPPGSCDPCGPGDYDRLGQIMITAGQSQPGLSAPNGGTAKATNGEDVILPYDHDGNGFDTYDVIDSTTVDNRQWVALFLGDSDNPVWVPVDQVTPLTSLPGNNPILQQ
jgi:hypothetical protein